jgi:uncharacterized protein GlcG (DUF336 family)
MPRPLATLIAATFAAALTAPAAAQLTDRRDLALGGAYNIATAAVESCRAQNVTTIAVVVVDRAGEIMAALRDDNARPHAMETARRMAYTARTFGVATSEFFKELSSRPVRREQTTLPHITALPGGVPIKLGNDVIGGIGVAGSPKNEECANAGLEKVRQALQ